MKRLIAVLLAVGSVVGLASCENRGNPTVDGGYVWQNYSQAESESYDMTKSHTLNYNVADSLAAQAEGITEERIKIAQEILAELDQYPDFSDDRDENYIIKLRAAYKCVLGFYYMNSTYDQLNSLVEEYKQAYEALTNESKTSYVPIKTSLFTDAAKQLELYGQSQTNT